MSKKSSGLNKLKSAPRIWAAQGGKCAHCGESVMCPGMFASEAPNAPTVDHVIPKSQGGKHKFNSLIVHRACNQKKDKRPATICEMFAAYWLWRAATDAPAEKPETVMAVAFKEIQLSA